MSMYNAALLKLAREQNGLTQSALADRLDVKQALLSKYENGGVVPPEHMQQRIADALGYPVSFFMQENDEIPSGLVFHRKRSTLPATVRVRIEAEVRARSLDTIKLFQFYDRSSTIIPRDYRSPENMARAIREYWAVPRGPIDNLTELLERNNIVVLQFDFGTYKLDGFFMPLPGGIISIAINSNKVFSPDRRRHTLAHECGHALLEHCKDFPSPESEKDAEKFAAELLMPCDDILPELKKVPLTIARLRELKSRWKVSMGSLLYRAHYLGVIKESTYRRMWMLFSSLGFRKSEPDCGILEEKPNLLNLLMRDFVAGTQDVLGELFLTQVRFHERYPEIKLEGQSMMTPMIL